MDRTLCKDQEKLIRKQTNPSSLLSALVSPDELRCLGEVWMFGNACRSARGLPTMFLDLFISCFPLAASVVSISHKSDLKTFNSFPPLRMKHCPILGHRALHNESLASLSKPISCPCPMGHYIPVRSQAFSHNRTLTLALPSTYKDLFSLYVSYLLSFRSWLACPFPKCTVWIFYISTLS